MDRYSKIVLTLIALALWADVFAGLAPGKALIRDANAQAQPTATAVYLVAGPAGATPVVVPVNVTQVGTKWVQQGATLPVYDAATAAMQAAQAAAARAATTLPASPYGSAPPPPPANRPPGS